MTSAEGSFLGIAKQVAKGTPNITDASFKYMLFTESGLGVNNIFRPLDREVGGGALVHNLVKVGVNSGGPIAFIPRPSTLGHLLHGVVGGVASAQEAATATYHHTFTLPTDQFDAPYFTLRNAPGNMWGEQFQDSRVTGLSLDWRGADFVRGSVAFLGGLPTPVTTGAWTPATYLDNGPQFLSPISNIEVPTGSPVKVLGGSFVASSDIPLDEQYVVGNYAPDGFDIQNRAFMLSLIVKVVDSTLHNKMAYDPAGGSAWAADVFKEADLNIDFISDVESSPGFPFKFSIAANGSNQASGLANVAWSVQPLGLRSGRQVTMRMTGLFLSATTPLSIVLDNTDLAY